MLGLLAFNYNATRQGGKVAGRRQPPASSVEKYLGHLLSYLDSLGLAWLGFLALLLLLLLPGNVALTVRHETCLYLSISPTSIAASAPHFCISPTATATATPSPSSSAGRVLTNWLYKCNNCSNHPGYIFPAVIFLASLASSAVGADSSSSTSSWSAGKKPVKRA